MSIRFDKYKVVENKIKNILIYNEDYANCYPRFFYEPLFKSSQKMSKMYNKHGEFPFYMKMYNSETHDKVKVFTFHLNRIDARKLIDSLKACNINRIVIPISCVNFKYIPPISDCSNCAANRNINEVIRQKTEEAKNKGKEEARGFYYHKYKDYYINKVGTVREERKIFQEKLLNIEYKVNDILKYYTSLSHDSDEDTCYAKVTLSMTKDILYQLGLIDEDGNVISLTE